MAKNSKGTPALKGNAKSMGEVIDISDVDLVLKSASLGAPEGQKVYVAADGRRAGSFVGLNFKAVTFNGKRVVFKMTSFPVEKWNVLVMMGLSATDEMHFAAKGAAKLQPLVIDGRPITQNGVTVYEAVVLEDGFRAAKRVKFSCEGFDDGDVLATDPETVRAERFSRTFATWNEAEYRRIKAAAHADRLAAMASVEDESSEDSEETVGA